MQVSNGEASTRPIAGTRPRSSDAASDRALAAELILSEKERAEHLMLVDLARNDLGKVAALGSVEVDELMTVEDYAQVRHIVSNVRARLAPGRDAFDALSAMFPGGTITGVPKIRCMQILDGLEPAPRGFYTGALFYATPSGRLDANILIRSAVVAGGRVTFHAGGGIVADSDPDREWKRRSTKPRECAWPWRRRRFRLPSRGSEGPSASQEASQLTTEASLPAGSSAQTTRAPRRDELTWLAVGRSHVGTLMRPSLSAAHAETNAASRPSRSVPVACATRRSEIAACKWPWSGGDTAVPSRTAITSASVWSVVRGTSRVKDGGLEMATPFTFTALVTTKDPTASGATAWKCSSFVAPAATVTRQAGGSCVRGLSSAEARLTPNGSVSVTSTSWSVEAGLWRETASGITVPAATERGWRGAA